jgi:hypothetical protein
MRNSSLSISRFLKESFKNKERSPECYSSLVLHQIPSKRMGFSFYLSMQCSVCMWKQDDGNMIISMDFEAF